ncbi:hypothetical protein RE6C_03247 [Rhodopirellula europaea 6C]|uniref:Uncharacterized protein n=1 Tax=Rhodopirellula europaea 6C TaxID=1263867 RepID=M2B1B6_9BACT|nr:hypothetical protein RE6C_03247 [Rhodopirellula europaea 6C]
MHVGLAKAFDDGSLCSKASAWAPCGTWPTSVVNRILGESGYELTWLP